MALLSLAYETYNGNNGIFKTTLNVPNNSGKFFFISFFLIAFSILRITQLIFSHLPYVPGLCVSDITEEGKEFLIQSLCGIVFIENIHTTWHILSQGPTNFPDI
jgi:hypothetical protein